MDSCSSPLRIWEFSSKIEGIQLGLYSFILKPAKVIQMKVRNFIPEGLIRVMEILCSPRSKSGGDRTVSALKVLSLVEIQKSYCQWQSLRA